MLIKPDTWFRAVWDWVVILFVLYSAVIVPLEISFAVRSLVTGEVCACAHLRVWACVQQLGRAAACVCGLIPTHVLLLRAD